MTEPLSSPAIHRSTRHLERLEAIERIAKIVGIFATFAMVALIGIALVTVVFPFQHREEKTLAVATASQAQQTCSTRVNAELLAIAFRALSAPPAPNPTRDQTVAQGLALAMKILDDPAHACDP